jgi:hypothetical protein
MWKDPIVEEIHEVREQIAKEGDYDLKRIMDRLREKEKQRAGTRRIVHKKPAQKVM